MDDDIQPHGRKEVKHEPQSKGAQHHEAHTPKSTLQQTCKTTGERVSEMELYAADDNDTLTILVEKEARSRLQLYYDDAQRERRSASPKILQALQFMKEFHEEEEAARAEYLRKLSVEAQSAGERGTEKSSSGQEYSAEDAGPRQSGRSFSRYVRMKDVSLEALDKVQMIVSVEEHPMKMALVHRLPKYEAWVPVMRNFFVNEIDLRHFIPYFGDSKKKINMAREVSEMMRQDMTSALDMDSDSESESEDEKELRGKPDEEKVRIAKEQGARHGLGPRTKRSVAHRILLELTELHGKSEQVWIGLSQGLEEPEVQSLARIRDIEERRVEEKKKILKQKKESVKQMRQIAKFISEPETPWPLPDSDGDGNAAAALKYFCFNCQDFACQQHAGENVPPVVAIPDQGVDKRIEQLEYNKNSMVPCSRCCFLLDKWMQSPIQLDEGQPWTSIEEAMLLEAVKVFHLDPCHVAIVVRSKTCREVNDKMRSSRVCKHLKLYLDQIAAPRSKERDESWSISSEEEVVRRRRKPQSGRSRKSAPVPQRRKPKPTSDDQPYQPCNHQGPCVKSEDCSCAIRDVDCESRCGCKHGRYVQGRDGIFWDGIRDGRGWAEARLDCKRRTFCECKTGACNTEACACHAKRKACNPDLCNGCGCNALPLIKWIPSGRCRNTGAITSCHKQTFVGRSTVHGYGLFAGESFRQGDFVGPYAGRLMATELGDKALRVSQAKHQTFAFKLHEELTVDGGLLGSKAKFINHAEDEYVNCVARCERVKGEARIVLKTCRAVECGEEFFFNYAVIDETGQGNEWIKGGGTASTRDRASSRKTRSAEVYSFEASTQEVSTQEASPGKKDNKEQDPDFKPDSDEELGTWH